jgi:hypothetical protein
MTKYTVEQKSKWAAAAGVPLATFLGVVEVYEGAISKSRPDIRQAAVSKLEAFLDANPQSDLSLVEVAARIGLKETEIGFVRFHTRKLLLKHQVRKAA